jgi:predicted metalloprotease with PDZ domain
MRAPVLLAMAAVAAGALPLRTGSAQTRVVSADSLRVLERVAPIPPEQLRARLAELSALMSNQRTLEEQLRALRESNTADARRVAEVQVNLARTLDRVVPLQSALMLSCRAADAPVESSGFIGIAFDDELMIGETRAEGGPVTVRFAGTPRITSVEPGSPAARAGIRAGDEWVALGARALAGASVDQITSDLRPGTRQTLRLRRGGAEREVELVVAARASTAPTADACGQLASLSVQSVPRSIQWRVMETRDPTLIRPPTPPIPTGVDEVRVVPSRIAFYTTAPTVYGARFRELDADAREFVAYQGDGVLVDQVAAGSPAEAAGLRAFDVVTRVNGAAVQAVQDVLRVTSEARRVELTLQRKGVVRTVVLTR